MTAPTQLLKVHSRHRPIKKINTLGNNTNRMGACEYRECKSMHGLSQSCRLPGVRACSTDRRVCLGSYLSFGAEFERNCSATFRAPGYAITVIKIYYEYSCQLRNFKRGFTILSEDNVVRLYRALPRSPEDVLTVP